MAQNNCTVVLLGGPPNYMQNFKKIHGAVSVPNVQLFFSPPYDFVYIEKVLPENNSNHMDLANKFVKFFDDKT